MTTVKQTAAAKARITAAARGPSQPAPPKTARCSPRLVLACGLAAALVQAGCGNYSNADLEFMSALPQRDDVAVTIPRQANLTTSGSAEGWKTTLEVTQTFNRVADAFLTLIENVRSYYPTARNANERIWGPFPSRDSPGWQVEFNMIKEAADSGARFAYALVMIPPPGSTLPSNSPRAEIIGGSFDAAGGVRVGAGRLTVTLDDARAAGAVFPGLEKLRQLTIDYHTRGWPREVTMTVLNVAPADPTTDAQSATYAYSRAENGDGTMKFTFSRDVVPGAPGVPGNTETLMVESRWLGRGQGRADISVTGGDSGGLATSLECWDDGFQSTFKVQSWAPLATTGDAGTCIAKP